MTTELSANLQGGS